MIITFVCPSSPRPIGGVTALYEFANALCRRGHDVHLAHGDFFNCRIGSLDDLDWFSFEPGLHHILLPADPATVTGPTLPRADVIFGTGAPPEAGLPVMMVQGFEMLYPWLEQRAFRVPCLKVCIASWLVDVGVYFGVDRDQFRVVPMGIDHDRFRPPIPDAPRRFDVAVLYNGHPAKGWEVARRALESVRMQHPSLAVVVFGASEPDEALPGWMTFWANPKPEILVADVYQASKIFLQASDYEGFGFTAVEAMACGAALVTTDNGGSREYAIHDGSALVAEPRDVEGLSAAILTLLDDDDRRSALAVAGERSVRRFDWDLGAELLEEHLLAYLADPDAFRVEPGPELTDLALKRGDLVRRVLGPPSRR